MTALTLPEPTHYDARLAAICRAKRPYTSKQEARDAARRLARQTGHGGVYQCQSCGKYHITKANAENVRRHQREDSGDDRVPIHRASELVDDLDVIARALTRVLSSHYDL